MHEMQLGRADQPGRYNKKLTSGGMLYPTRAENESSRTEAQIKLNWLTGSRAKLEVAREGSARQLDDEMQQNRPDH